MEKTRPAEQKKENYGVLLPCAPEDFGEFVSNLLGKPQTIERQIYDAFEIRKENIISTYHLVNQRIHQQNEAALIQFSVRIIYDDHSSVLLNGLEDFEHYTEISPITSVGATLSWSYLIKFKNKHTPEKQEIDLSFGLGDGFRFRGIFLRISHTERTWGVDIESLLTNHVKRFITSHSESERFVSKYSDIIGFISGSLFFLGAIVGVIYTSSKFIASYTDKIAELGSGAIAEASVVSAKLDFLINVISTGVWPRFVFSVIVFLVICLVISIFLGTWIGSSAYSRPRSFVLLSKTAEEKRKKILSKMKRDWFMFWVSVITSIGTGIVANLIFNNFFSGVA